MARIDTPKVREIVSDFAAEIARRKEATAKPSTDVIPFRNDVATGHERPVVQVPVGLLRFRKDNGRIASDVLDYETNESILDESDDESQSQLRQFLWNKDPEKTAQLMKSIEHGGQREPAVITCDGFLVNGNRRKMVLDKLREKYPEEPKYKFMKVVILPGERDPGGPPTLREIEELENRYQLQSDGKAEYYGFDRALSIAKKAKIGFSIEAQVRDDPQYAGASDAEIKKAVGKWKKEYLRPLESVERYLKQFGREGMYRTVSTGRTDREGRWQAFLDYSNTYARDFQSDKNRVELGIEDDEIGELEEAAFNIIRFRALPGLPKVHTVMRNFGKYCRTPEGKKHIKAIARNVETGLTDDECTADDGSRLDITEIDAKWAAENKQEIIYRLQHAVSGHQRLDAKETPLTLLEASLKKLKHKNMDISAIGIGDLSEARSITSQIQDKAKKLEKEIYWLQKDVDKLASSKQ